MSQVFCSMTMSLDGFIAGESGEDKGLHQWVFNGDVPVTIGGVTLPHTSEVSAEVTRAAIYRTGAVVIGRTSFNSANRAPPFQLPTVVLSRQARDSVQMQGTPVHFVTEGIMPALERAQSMAGSGDVLIFGGASLVQQYLKAGLLDEVSVDLVPIFLGSGIRLFEGLDEGIKLEPIEVRATPDVTHLRYRVKKG